LSGGNHGIFEPDLAVHERLATVLRTHARSRLFVARPRRLVERRDSLSGGFSVVARMFVKLAGLSTACWWSARPSPVSRESGWSHSLVAA
jgi:hypothetical protein